MDFEKLVELSYTDRRGFLKFLAKGVAVAGVAGLGLQALPLREFLEPERLFMGDWKGNFPILQADGRLMVTDDKGSRLITREELEAVVTPGLQANFTFLWDDLYWGGKSPALIGSQEDAEGQLHYLGCSKKCTHEGCSVYIKDGEWFSPCHAGRFDIHSGEVLGGPPPVPLQIFEVEFDEADRVVLSRTGLAEDYY